MPVRNVGERFVPLVLSELRFFISIPHGYYYYADAEKHMKKDGRRWGFDVAKEITTLEKLLESHNSDIYSGELGIVDIIESNFQAHGLSEVSQTSGETGYWNNVYQIFNQLWNEFIRNSREPERGFEQNVALITERYTSQFSRGDVAQDTMLMLGNSGMGRGPQEQRDMISSVISQLLTDRLILESLADLATPEADFVEKVNAIREFAERVNTEINEETYSTKCGCCPTPLRLAWKYLIG